MIEMRFRNTSDGPLTLFVEPWCSQDVVSPGAAFSIRYLPRTDGEDTSSVDLQGDFMTFWCEGPDYEIEIEGKIVIPFGVA